MAKIDKTKRKRILDQCRSCNHGEVVKKGMRMKVVCTYKNRLEIEVPCKDFNK